MRLLMTNALNKNLLAPSYYRHLKKQVDAIEGFRHNELLISFYQKKILNKVLYRLFPKSILQPINTLLESKVQSFKPDVVWLFKGMEIMPETLLRIKEKGILLVNYNLDHPFKYVSNWSGNKNVLDSITLYDLHFSYSQKIIQELVHHYPGINTAYLPFGYSLHEEDFNQIVNLPEIKRAAFVGYADKNRAAFIRKMLQASIPIDVYGQNWNQYLKESEKLKIYPPAFGLEYWRVLRSYRIQYNIFRPHNHLSHNMRSFEIPAAGGVMLAPVSPEHQQFFENGKEAFYFTDEEDAIELSNILLKMDESQIRNIRTQSRKRSVESKYSYADRSLMALNTIKALLNK